MNENWMTCVKAANVVGLTPVTVCRWMKRGLLAPKMSVGSCLLIDVVELAQVANQLRQLEGRGHPRLSERK
jgi:predicted site-specific integrase-resolvase